jgi:xylulokinase
VKAVAVVLNLGLKSIRAIAFGENGQKLVTASRPVQTLIRDEWVEQDANEWWLLACECLREVAEAGYARPDLMTVTASSACLVAVDAEGRVLRRVIMVSDRRARQESERIGNSRAFRDLVTANGSFTPDPYYLLPKSLWIQRNEPETWTRIRHLLTPADFLVMRLSGEVATDPLNAEKYYWTASGYPGALLQEFSIPEELLPPVRHVGTRLGTLIDSAASVVGLKAHTPIYLSTYDAICAFWGSGVSVAGDVADVSGTVTSVRALVASELPRAESRVFSQVMPGVSGCVAGGSNNLGGGLIEWLKQSFYPHDELAYERIEVEAASSAPTARGVLFLPYLLGERCPIWDTEARGVIFGLERHHGRADVARAVLESAAFSVQDILSTLAEHGSTFNRIRVSGGLARLGLVNRIKADVTGVPVEVVSEFETTALGAFILAGVGAGVFSSVSDAAGLVRVREVILPDRTNEAAYRDWFSMYRDTYKALRPMFARRAAYKTLHFLDGVDRLENL